MDICFIGCEWRTDRIDNEGVWLKCCVRDWVETASRVRNCSAGRISMGATKAKLERSARGLLYGSGLFFPLRAGYQFFFNRDKMVFRRRMRDFYAAFVRPGGTVFDIGANIGMYSEVFSE